MLPLAPTYITDMLAQVCTLQNFLQDVAQGQVAYSLVAFCIHQSGPQQWRNRSFIWFGICVGIQWICSYLLPLPQILMSNLYICLAFLPNQFLPIYSLIFLLVLPIFLHLIIYIIVIIFKNKEITNTQIHPTEYINPTELRYQTSMAYILIMALLFDLIGYGPRGILIIIDPELQQSITTYEALTTLPSFCLIINIGLLYKMNKEIPKKIRSTFRR